MKENGCRRNRQRLARIRQENEAFRFSPSPTWLLLTQIGQKLGIDQISKITRMINVLTIGISFALLKYDRALAEKAVRDTFSEKGKIADMNALAFNHAYDYASEHFQRQLQAQPRENRRSRKNAFSSPATKLSPWAKFWADAESKPTIPLLLPRMKANTWKRMKSSKHMAKTKP